MSIPVVSWERQPARLDWPRQDWGFTEEDLFAIASVAAERRTSLPDPQDVRVFADENIVNPSRVGPWLPDRDRDGDFAGYADTLRRRSKSFALTINSMQQFSWEFWRGLRSTVDPVLSAAGALPAGGTDCHLIASVYGTAPTLVHKDTAGVFTYVVSGYKRYYVWPYEVFSGIAGDLAAQRQVNLPSTIRHEDHLDSAVVLEGGPGSVFYWPSDRWHCATSDGELAVSLHVAHYTWEDRLESLLRRMSRLGAAALGTRRFATDDPSFDTASDDEIQAVLSGLMGNAGWALEPELRLLKRSTASNFEVVPPLRAAVPPQDSDPLTVPAGSAIKGQTIGGHSYAGVNGHVLKVDGAPWMEPFTAALTTGTTRTVAEWLQIAGEVGGSAEEARTIVTELVRRGALDRTAP